MQPIAPVLDVLLIRHAETDWTAAGRYQGRQNPPLSPAGQAAARRLARQIADGQSGGRDIALVLSSPLARARETAEPIAAATGARLLTDPRLVELDYGDWEGLTQAEVKARWPEDLRAWKRAPASARPTGGETLAAAAARLHAALAGLGARAPAGGLVAVVTHDMLIRLALLAARGEAQAGVRGVAVPPASAHPLCLRDGRIVPAAALPPVLVPHHA